MNFFKKNWDLILIHIIVSLGYPITNQFVMRCKGECFDAMLVGFFFLAIVILLSLIILIITIVRTIRHKDLNNWRLLWLLLLPVVAYLVWILIEFVLPTVPSMPNIF